MDTVAKRCAGAQIIKSLTEGKGETLKFNYIPIFLLGAVSNDIAGLDSNYAHPLKGAVFFTEECGNKTASITIFQNDCKDYIAHAFANWFMGWTFMSYADEETKAKIKVAKKVAA